MQKIASLSNILNEFFNKKLMTYHLLQGLLKERESLEAQPLSKQWYWEI